MSFANNSRSPTPASENQQHFRTADGTEIRNEGDRRVLGYTDTGRGIDMRYAVADVTVPLDSVSQLCDAGNTVVFTAKGWIIGQAGDKIDFVRHRDTYLRRTWVRRPKASTNSNTNNTKSRQPASTNTSSASLANGVAANTPKPKPKPRKKAVNISDPTAEDPMDVDDETDEINVAAMVIEATRPLSFRRQGSHLP